MPLLSVETNENKTIDSPTVPEGPDVIVVSGVTVSIVQLLVAGVGSVRPWDSVARTENECEPSASASVVSGDEQLEKLAPSCEQVKVAGLMEDEKAKVVIAVALKEPFPGPDVIVVFGATPVKNERAAGVASVLPALSVARTANSWWPSARGPAVKGELHGLKARASLSTAQPNVKPVEPTSQPLK